MVQCGVKPSGQGNVASQHGTVSFSAVEMSSAESAEELDPLFVNIEAIICDHSYIPMHFGGFVDNALVYISRFVRQVLRKLPCDTCRGSQVKDAMPT